MSGQEELAVCLQRLRGRVSAVEAQIEDLRGLREKLAAAKKELRRRKTLTIRVQEAFAERQEAEGLWDTGALCCLRCGHTCGQALTWPWAPGHCDYRALVADDATSASSASTASSASSASAAVTHGRCSSCPGACPAEEHVSASWRYVMKTRTVSKAVAPQRKQTFGQNMSEVTELEQEAKHREDRLKRNKKLYQEEALHITRQLQTGPARSERDTELK